MAGRKVFLTETGVRGTLSEKEEQVLCALPAPHPSPARSERR